jgi:ABC-2 type transport system ATP-binding protein
MNALTIKNLKKTYDNGNQALKGIDLSVKAGDFYALLGPNGAGKTTAIGIVSSLVNKTDGVVEIFGHDINTDFEAAKACLGLVRVEKYLRELRLWDRRNDIARSLSGGMKRRLMIARALVHEPRLLILDEPTAGVDIEIRRSMWEYLQKINAAGTTIILTTHYLEEAESLCRHIGIIDGGKIIEDAKMSTVLGKLQGQVLILSLADDLHVAPLLNGFVTRLRDDNELEVEKGPEHDINDLFEQLSIHGIRVVSMRNKANRLEELFLRLVDSKSSAEDRE